MLILETKKGSEAKMGLMFGFWYSEQAVEPQE